MKTGEDVKINEKKFRSELTKIMPGYKWTVHKPGPWPDEDRDRREAIGVQSAGSNRMSTLCVVKRTKRDGDGVVETEYEVKSAGYGTHSPWLDEETAPTLARALRTLQNYYVERASTFSAAQLALERGRKSLNRDGRD